MGGKLGGGFAGCPNLNYDKSIELRFVRVSLFGVFAGLQGGFLKN